MLELLSVVFFLFRVAVPIAEGVVLLADGGTAG